MKSFLKILFFTFAICLSSCQHVVQYPAELLIADSLCSSNPDSAMVYLEGLSVDIPNYREPARRYYQLLTIKAQDKAFISHNSDSLILDVVSYYEDGGDPGLLPEAYYYAGRVYRDLGDAPQALDYFHKAFDAITPKEDSASMKFKGIILSQTGYLLRAQHLYEEACTVLNESLALDSICNDSISMYSSLLDLGQTYRSLKKYQEAIDLFSKAERIATEIHDSLKYKKAIVNKIITYSTIEDYQYASKEEVAEIIAKNDINMPKIYLALLYSYIGLKDSAYHYYNLSQESGTLVQKAQAKIWLANYAIHQKNTEKGLSLLKEHIELTNRISQQQNSEAIGLAQSLYNYNLREKAYNQLKIQKYKNEINSIYLKIVITILCIVLLASFTLLLQTRNIATKQRRRLQLLYEMKTKQEHIIEQNRKRIAELTDNQNKYNENTIRELEELHAINNQMALSETFDIRWRVTDEYALVNSHIQKEKPLSYEEWTRIESKVRLMNPQFITRLQTIYDFSEIEWKTSILIRLHVTPTNISILCSKTVNAVSNIRKRLYMKVTKQKGSASNWDKFILEL